jgi:hypothetical protein
MKQHVEGLFLPLSVAAFPILFLYGHNAANLQLSSLVMPLGLSLLVAAFAYGLFFLFQRKAIGGSRHASLSAGFFLLFYYLYGSIYQKLISPDKFPVYHFVLLPVVLALAFYAGFFISKIKPSPAAVIQKAFLFFSLFLVGYNVVVIILPVELQRARYKQNPSPVASAAKQSDVNQKYPDIYYIIFDEYERLDVMKSYFHDPDVDQFTAFLQQNNFFLVTNSRTPTINTQTEMSSRLNLQQYNEKSDVKVTLAAINDNKVMAVLKRYGYTTAALDMAFPKITADYRINYDPAQVAGMAVDEFRQTFLGETMFSAFIGYFQDTNMSEAKQRDLIFYTLDQTADLANLRSPKFVYTHVLLPHEPFIFDKDGNLLPPQDNYDWHYYMGQHQYATKLMENLITKLLANADPANPPVIIIQSDHGARNMIRRAKDNILMDGYLENYPIDNAYKNFNAMYLPGIDPSSLNDKMPPINTMVLVLNHYLNAGVALGPAAK